MTPRALLTSGPNRLIQGRHGCLLYNRNDQYVGRSLEEYGEYAEAEVALFRQLLRPGATVVEAGANIGAHTLVLAQLVGPQGRVFAFEPQRLCFQVLCANLALNGLANVVARQSALGEAPGRLYVPLLDPQAEQNFGGLSLGSHPQGEEVPIETVDGLNLPGCLLLKADVEGMEQAVLRGAEQTLARCRPFLYLENDRPEKSAALIEYLLERKYRLYWHVTPLFSPSNHFANPTNVFPGIVAPNMLGVHPALQAELTGFVAIEGPDSDWRSALPRGPG